MKKKKKPEQPVQWKPSTADSDLVRLTKEFESIKQQLAENDAVLESLFEQRTMAEQEVERVRILTQTQRENAQLQRRVLDTQFVNVRELLGKAFEMRGDQYPGTASENRRLRPQ